jgi:mannose-1-phosphate guanylyltransferase
MKERITITIEKELLDILDNQVDKTSVKNRSHAVELALTKLLKKEKLEQAIILAGGNYQVKQNNVSTPTILAKINNITAIEHNIRSLKKHGIKEIYLCLGYKKNEVKKLLGDGLKLGVTIHYIEEDENNLQGTAGAIAQVAQYIKGPFVVTNGDVLKDINIREMFEFHKKQGTTATIALTTVPNPNKYGVVILNGNRVHSYIEKPQSNVPTNLINSGLYIFETEVFSHLPVGYGRLEDDVFPKLAKNEDVAGYVFFGKWNYLRTQEDLESAQKNW